MSGGAGAGAGDVGGGGVGGNGNGGWTNGGAPAPRRSYEGGGGGRRDGPRYGHRGSQRGGYASRDYSAPHFSFPSPISTQTSRKIGPPSDDIGKTTPGSTVVVTPDRTSPPRSPNSSVPAVVNTSTSASTSNGDASNSGNSSGSGDRAHLVKSDADKGVELPASL